MHKNKQDILLFSGGMDSFIAWYYLGKPHCLYVDLGHRYAVRERLAIDKLQKAIPDLDVTFDNRLVLGDVEQPDAFIPMRNAFLAEIGALYSYNIWLVAQKGEMTIPDRSPEFFKGISKLTSMLREQTIKVDTPFKDMTKVDMVAWYRSKGLPIDNLLMTSSCYHGNNCGQCSACFRRFIALELNGLGEKYLVDPWTTPLAKEYLHKAKTGRYEQDRAEEIIAVLEKYGV
jgi:7-cyano-7-deazaguanine synthase in queuosine biosynthesis